MYQRITQLHIEGTQLHSEGVDNSSLKVKALLYIRICESFSTGKPNFRDIGCLQIYALVNITNLACLMEVLFLVTVCDYPF